VVVFPPVVTTRIEEKTMSDTMQLPPPLEIDELFQTADVPEFTALLLTATENGPEVDELSAL
jgi:hypothetical protein